MSIPISDKAWGPVDESKLPRACFLWVGGANEKQKNLKKNWHLPVYEGTGGINPTTGMYRQRGALNRNAVKAAYAGARGARQGKPMAIPPAVKARITSLGARCGYDVKEWW